MYNRGPGLIKEFVPQAIFDIPVLFVQLLYALLYLENRWKAPLVKDRHVPLTMRQYWLTLLRNGRQYFLS